MLQFKNHLQKFVPSDLHFWLVFAIQTKINLDQRKKDNVYLNAATVNCGSTSPQVVFSLVDVSHSAIWEICTHRKLSELKTHAAQGPLHHFILQKQSLSKQHHLWIISSNKDVVPEKRCCCSHLSY